jgi:hypothetical protein
MENWLFDCACKGPRFYLGKLARFWQGLQRRRAGQVPAGVGDGLRGTKNGRIRPASMYFDAWPADRKKDHSHRRMILLQVTGKLKKQWRI